MKRLAWGLAALVILGGYAFAQQGGGEHQPGGGAGVTRATGDTRWVNVTGDQMTGPLSVDGGLSAQSATINGTTQVNGQIKTGLNPAGTAADQASLTANPGACGANEYLIAASVDGGVKFGADCEGDCTCGGALSVLSAATLGPVGNAQVVCPGPDIATITEGGTCAFERPDDGTRSFMIGHAEATNDDAVLQLISGTSHIRIGINGGTIGFFDGSTFVTGFANARPPYIWQVNSAGLMTTTNGISNGYMKAVGLLGAGTTAQTVTVNDNTIGATPATVTITPTSSTINGTCNDADGCTITWSETGAFVGEDVVFVNIATNAFTTPDSAGVYEGSAPTIGAGDVLTLRYSNAQWYQRAFSDN